MIRASAQSTISILMLVSTTLFDIQNSLSDTVIMRLAKRASHTMEIPLGTTFLTLLGGAATAVATNYATQFRTGTGFPLFCMLRASGHRVPVKVSVVSLAMTPYMSAMIKHNQRVRGYQ